MDPAQEEKIKILYVDDELHNLNAFKAYFRRHPRLEIYTAQSGAEGLEILKSTLIHVIMSDQKMPNMTGIEFLEKVQSDFPDPIRIIVTAHREIQILQDAQKDGKIYDFHDKPWDLVYLEKLILNAFEAFMKE